MQKWLKLFEENNYVNIKKRVEETKNINISNENGESLLILAIKMGCDNDIAMLLLESGADYTHCDNEGVSIIDFAIAYNDYDLVKYLIEQKSVDINKSERKSGFTALMAAVCYDRYEIVKLLLKNGADIDAVDSSGLTAKMFAQKMRKQKMIDLLTSNAV